MPLDGPMKKKVRPSTSPSEIYLETNADKFETLCCVEAELSAIPYRAKRTKSKSTYYERKADVILLVGLTELKAQIGWIDSKTVRAYFILCMPSLPSFMCGPQRKERRSVVTFPEFLL